MNQNEWTRQFQEVEATVARLEQSSNTAELRHEILREAIEELHVTMEELTTTGEELRQREYELSIAYEQATAERARYRDLFEFAPDGYLVTDARGIIREANQAAARLLNIGQGLLHGRLLILFVLPEDQPGFIDLLARLAAGEPVQHWNLRMQSREASSFSAAIVAQPAHDERSGQVKSIRWLLRDVTTQVSQARALQNSEAALSAANASLEQRVEERTAELRSSEARLQLVLQGSPVTVFQQDTDLRYIWAYNPANSMSPADVIGKFDYDTMLPADAERLTSIKRRVLETGQGSREEVSLTVDGRSYWFDLRLEPMRDQAGTITGITGVATDISDYHRAKEAQRFLAEVGNLLTTTLDTNSLLQQAAQLIAGRMADCCVFALPADNNSIELRVVHHHDPARLAVLPGWLEQGLHEQPEQHPFWQALHSNRTSYFCDDAPAAGGNWLHAAQQQVAITSLLVVSRHARGQIIGVMGLLNEQPGRYYSREDIHLAEEVARQVSLVLDTTRSYEAALHARAQAEEAVRMRDHLFGIISHDLKTPITTVKGYLYLLRRQLAASDLPNIEKLLQQSGKIETAMTQMSHQIDELLNIARLQAGEPLHIEREPIDLLALIRRIVDVQEQVNSKHTIQLQTSLAALSIMGDETQLERVFTNLLSNAVKYSPQHGDILILLHLEERNGTAGAFISIRDRGIGIPAADLPYVFEPFRRGSNVQRHSTGMGLGLVSVRYIVEQHGGRISVASEEGSGSTFAIWLPLPEMPGLN